MEQSYQDFKRNSKHQKHALTFFLFITFSAILLFLIYSSFYPNKLSKTLTGDVVSPIEDSIKIYSEITPPEKLAINGKIDKIELKIKSSTLSIGKQKIELPDKTSLVINNYTGKLSFSSSILELDGKTSKIFIDGLPIQSERPTTIHLEKTEFTYLQLKGFYLNSLSYITSGKIRLGEEKIIVNLNKEKIKIEDVHGDLEIRKNILIINGYTKQSNISKLLESISPEPKTLTQQ